MTEYYHSFDTASISSEDGIAKVFSIVEEEINSVFERILQELKLRRDLLLDKLYKMKIDFDEQIRERREEIEELVAMKNKIMQVETKTFLKQASITKENCLKEIEFGVGQFKSPLIPPVPEFAYDCSEILAKINTLGCLEDARSLYIEKCRPYHYIGTKGTGRNEFNNPRSLYLDEASQELYVVDAGNSRIKILTNYLEYKQSFGKSHLKSPWGITRWNEFIFVTDECLNQVLKFSTQSFKLVGKVGWRRDKLYNDPRGICTSNRNSILVAYLTSDLVAEFSPELVHTRNIGDKVLFHPHDVNFSHDTLFVLDESFYCIHLFNGQGIELLRLIERGLYKSVLHTIFFTLDDFSNIFLSDVHRNSIKVFSKAGQLIHDIEGAVAGPKGLALTKKNQLISCSGSSHRIEIF